MKNFLDSGGAELLTASLALLTALANVYTQIMTGRQIDDLIKSVDRQASDYKSSFTAISKHLRKAQAQIDTLIGVVTKRQSGGPP